MSLLLPGAGTGNQRSLLPAYHILSRRAGGSGPQADRRAGRIEGVEKYAVVSALLTDEIERGNATLIAGDSFAVDKQERERRRANVSTISGKRRRALAKNRAICDGDHSEGKA
jgi:hypothetical protein